MLGKTLISKIVQYFIDSRKQLTIQSYICIFSFSLLDIQFKLLKVHSLDESFIASKGFRTLTYSSNKRDRFREYSLKQSDPKLVFVISNCILGNMKPKVVVYINLLNINILKYTLKRMTSVVYVCLSISYKFV